MISRSLKNLYPLNLSLCVRSYSSSFICMNHANVDKEELEKFGRIGSEWWDSSSNAGVGPLHAMNPVRVQFVRENLAQLHNTEKFSPLRQLKGLEVLDIGCGGGLLAESLARLGANVTAIDPSKENIAVARMHSAKDPLTSKIEYKISTIQEQALLSKKFDAVCALEVIEHVPEVKDFVSSCFQCLKPTGSLFMSTINRNQKSYLMAIAMAEYASGMVPIGTHNWDKFVTPEEMKQLVEKDLNMGKLNQMKGIIIHPRSIPNIVKNCQLEWSLSDSDLDVNYIAHFVKI